MPAMRANVDVFISHLDVMTVGSLLVIARRAHRAVALDHGDAAARLGERHVHLAGERGVFRELVVLLTAFLRGLIVGLLGRLCEHGGSGENRAKEKSTAFHRTSLVAPGGGL